MYKKVSKPEMWLCCYAKWCNQSVREHCSPPSGTVRMQGVRHALTHLKDVSLFHCARCHHKTNQKPNLKVPPKFREVVEATLREFFDSIKGGKDAESSWKKQIYKVIARLDDTIPDYFKNPNFLEQLE